MLKKIAISAIITSAFAMNANAADYSLKFQSSDPAGSPNFALQQDWAENVKVMTNDRVEIEMMPAGAIVQYSETQDAVGAGILDGHITDPSYFTGKDPAFALIANPVGAWSDPVQMYRFMEYGGGLETLNELNEPYGLHSFGYTAPGLEAFISKKPLNGVDDLKGLKLRAPEGLVQNVFAAAGAAPVNLPQSEVYTSLDKGVIDAADATVYSTNKANGMHEVGPHPVFPGFHSLPMLEMSINKDTWDSMPADIQRILEVSAREFAYDMANRIIIEDMKAVAEDKANPDITVHNWSDEERAKFRTIAVNEWQNVASQSDNAQKVFEVLNQWLEEQGLLAQ